MVGLPGVNSSRNTSVDLGLNLESNVKLSLQKREEMAASDELKAR